MIFVPAILTTPNEFALCRRCDVTGTRYPGDELGRFFAHCPECGTTELEDTRDPFVVATEAHELVFSARALGLDPHIVLGRVDDAEAIDRIAGELFALELEQVVR